MAVGFGACEDDAALRRREVVQARMGGHAMTGIKSWVRCHAGLFGARIIGRFALVRSLSVPEAFTSCSQQSGTSGIRRVFGPHRRVHGIH